MHSVNTIMETKSICCILIFIFHSIAGDNKALGLEHGNPSSSNNENKIFVEQNHTFGITCNSNNEIKACSFVTPDNNLLTITHNFNQTWFEGGRIFIAIKNPYTCIITVQLANTNDMGEWKCILPVKSVEGYVNEYKLYNVSVSYKNTYLFIYAPVSIIFFISIAVGVSYYILWYSKINKSENLA